MLGKPAKFRKPRSVKSWHLTCQSDSQNCGAQCPARVKKFLIVARISASGLHFRRMRSKTKSRSRGFPSSSFELLRWCCSVRRD
jgi:hypothetical protein